MRIEMRIWKQLGIVATALGVVVVMAHAEPKASRAEAAEVIWTQTDAGSVMQTQSSTVTYLDPVITASRCKVDANSYENPKNSYTDLKVPTQITKQGGYYFIVDCYHDQVIYSQSMGAPLTDWKVMSTDVYQPHAIASDGQVYLVVDTENNRVQIFEWKNGRFQNTQRIENVGTRPHYIVYDEPTQSFYIWSSLTGEMYIAKRKNDADNTVYIAEIRQINELNGNYVRSFTISGDQILFPSGNHCYLIFADKNTLEVQGRFPVPENISGMAFIKPIGNYLYMTVSSDLNYDQSVATMIRTTDPASLKAGDYETVYGSFQTEGIPYYIDQFDGMFYMTNHGSTKGIFRFGVEDDRITNVAPIY